MQTVIYATALTASLMLVLASDPAAAEGKKSSGRGPVPQYIKDRVAAAKQAVFEPARTLRPPAPDRFRVAAIQFGGSNVRRERQARFERRTRADEEREDPSRTAVTGLIRRAAANGAKVIVTPELALFDRAEHDPAVGTDVVNSRDYRRGGLIHSMGRLARELGVTIVFHTGTLGQAQAPVGEEQVRREHWAFRNYDLSKLSQQDATRLLRLRKQLLADAKRPRYERFDAALAVDASGKIVANHHKFHSEWTYGTRGTSLKNSCFLTPAGKFGILVCADGQEALKKMPKKPRDPNKALLKQFIDQDDLAAIAYPTMWMGTGPGNMWRWKSVNQQSILAEVTRAYVIASNNNDGKGPGGGVYKPDGTPIESSINREAEIHYGDLPLLNPPAAGRR